jgi:hypothetical protein
MSVKTMLPILGVGSAALAIGLAVRRNAAHRNAASQHAAHPSTDPLTRRDRPSGIQTRLDIDDDELAAAVPLTSEFWDAAPEAAPESEAVLETLRPVSLAGTYDAIDTEDLTAEWLARATQAPPRDGYELDDPAEIPADSMSMISQASRSAAAFDGTEHDDDQDDER